MLLVTSYSPLPEADITSREEEVHLERPITGIPPSLSPSSNEYLYPRPISLPLSIPSSFAASSCTTLSMRDKAQDLTEFPLISSLPLPGSYSYTTTPPSAQFEHSRRWSTTQPFAMVRLGALKVAYITTCHTTRSLLPHLSIGLAVSCELASASRAATSTYLR